MWKGRPVIGSAVGGIIDQIAEGTGILPPDPGDLEAFGAAARLLLGDPSRAARLGKAAHAHVREQYVGDVHLLRYARLLGTLLATASTAVCTGPGLRRRDSATPSPDTAPAPVGSGTCEGDGRD
jgi:hypothetical protein